MENDKTVTTQQVSWHLRFTPNLEAKYRDYFFKTNLGFIRLSFLAAGLAAIAFTILSYTAMQDRIVNPTTHMYGLLSLIVLPLLALGSSYLPKFQKFYHTILFLLFVATFTAIIVQISNLPFPYRYSGYGAFLYLLLLNYGLARQKLTTAILIGVTGSSLFLFTANIADIYPKTVFVQICAYFFLTNFAGLAITYILERSQRTAFLAKEDLEWERQRAETLLRNILPSQVADRLMAGQGCIADQVSEATVMFVDIVGFCQRTRSISPEDLVTLLDGVFNGFDAIMEKHQVEKIKTIGDSYMAASGLLGHTENHCGRLVAAAQDVMDYVRHHTSGIEVRIGIHTGPVTAGVIGRKKMIYDLWGDTVNIAARMESHGSPGRIQVSEAVVRKLNSQGQFQFSQLQAIDVKGHGSLKVAHLAKRQIRGAA